MTEAPVSYSAQEAGAIIGKTANWMMTKARAGIIPCTQVGRTRRWTPRQLDQILRAGEKQPVPAPQGRAPARRPSAPGSELPLQARQPRRKRPAAA